jgi:hypothetical protein
VADVVIAFACPVDAVDLTAVLFGTAAAALVTSFFSQRYGDNLRTAFLIVLPVAYVGSALLIAARKHLEADTQRLFEVVGSATRQQVESQPSPE